MDDRPASIHVVKSGERLILARRWFSRSSLGVIAFAVVWNIFLILYGRQTLSAAAASQEEAFLLIPLGIVGVITAYLALASALNRTRLTADQQRLTVTHAPLPWRGRALPRDAVQQIVAKNYQSGNSQSQRRVTFAVVAQLRDGGQKRLVGDLSSAAEALYISKALRQYLGIDAPPASGEGPM